MSVVIINDMQYVEVERIVGSTISVFNFMYSRVDVGIEVYYLGTYMDAVETQSIRGVVTVRNNCLENFGLKEYNGVISVVDFELLLEELFRYGIIQRFDHADYMSLVKFQSQILQRS